VKLGEQGADTQAHKAHCCLMVGWHVLLWSKRLVLYCDISQAPPSCWGLKTQTTDQHRTRQSYLAGRPAQEWFKAGL